MLADAEERLAKLDADAATQMRGVSDPLIGKMARVERVERRLAVGGLRVAAFGLGVDAFGIILQIAGAWIAANP